MAWLVAGLGNPGDRYAATRHNAGAMVVQALASEAGEPFRKARFIPVDVAEIREGDDRVLLARSTQYMNVSGPGYASLAKRNGVPPDHVVACHDDLDLPFAALRIKFGSSTAGHHGLDSLVAGLRTPDFHRVRIGIGRPPGRQDPMDFVLEPFSRREREEIEIVIGEAALAVRSLVRDGLAATQDRFNRSGR